MKKSLLLLLIAVLGYFLWQQHSPPSSPAQQTLVLSGPFEFHGIDLSKDGSVFSRLGVTQSLTGLNPDGTVEPVLASHWEHNSTGTEWTFHIRNNVTFHDGQTLTAQDALVSLKRAMSRPGIIKNVPIDSLSANGMALHIKLTSPYRPLLSALAHFSLGILSADSFDSQHHITQLNATGPFQLASMIAPHKLSVTKFADYWSDPATIDTIEYQAGHRSESRALQVQSGQADIAYSIDAISKQALANNASTTIQSVSLPRTILLKLNNTHPLLSDVRVRQAISLALDRSGIVNSILYAPESEAYQLFSQNQSDWHITPPQSQRSLTLARERLHQAGWQKNAQGQLEKEGKVFQLNLITYADRPELPLIATAVQNQLQQLGMQLNVSIENSSAIPSGHHDNTLDMALIARNFGMAGTPLPLLFSDFSHKSGSDWGHMNWFSPTIHANLSRLLAENDPEKQRELSHQVTAELAAQLPVIPIAYSSQHVALNRHLSGLILDPFELNYRLEDVKFND